ncbi:MAG: VapE domain-containing protein, partial [Polyangiaceae bacterium]
GMGGVLAGGHDPEELKETGEIVASRELARINWRGRRLYVVYDASLTNPKKPLVALGAAYLGIALRGLGADVWLVRLPTPHPSEADIERGEFYVETDTGPDDYIAKYGKAAFQRLVDEAEPLDPSDRIARWTGRATEKAVKMAALLSDLPTLAYLHAADPATNAAFHAITKSALGAKEVRGAIAGYAARLRPKAKEQGEWVAKMKLTKGGAYEPSTHNALLVLRNDGRIKGLLAQDDMLGVPVVRRQPPWGSHDWATEREFSDSDAVRLAAWFDEQYGMKLATKTLHEIVDAAAADHRFHPVRDWLESLVWDGTPRLSTWLNEILGAASLPFVAVVSRKSLIQMVARAYEPGCLAKSVVVLEGKQDERKSTATRELVPNPTWWTDQLPADLSDKDASQNLRGVWDMELPELVSKKRSDIDSVKAFLSRLVDRYRPSFGRRTISVRRSCVFWGTTNEDTYLVDATGNVRWWPVRVGVVRKIDVEKLKELREQLFAEAVVAYKAKEPWWLHTEEEQALAREETEARRHPDAWEPKFAEALAPLERTTIPDLLGTTLDIAVKAQTQADMQRAARILQRFGWRRSSAPGESHVYLRPEGTTAGEAKDARVPTAPEEQGLRTLQTHGWTVTYGIVNGQRVRIVTQPTDDEANVLQLLQGV